MVEEAAGAPSTGGGYSHAARPKTFGRRKGTPRHNRQLSKSGI